MENSIGYIRNCYGCGVCVLSCPKDVIEIRENKDGFYEPVITDKENCINCGICLSVCAYADNKVAIAGEVFASYAAWSNHPSIRHLCSSGGIGFILASNLMRKGYKACGVRYNLSMQHTEHFIATIPETYLPAIGSKYLPSYTIPGLAKVNRTDKFFITGTPCQIDSLRRYIREKDRTELYPDGLFFATAFPPYTCGASTGNVSGIKWKKQVVLPGGTRRTDGTTPMPLHFFRKTTPYPHSITLPWRTVISFSGSFSVTFAWEKPVIKM